MTPKMFPPLPLSEWQATRDSVRGYAQVVGKIRRALTPYQRHWFHVNLRTSALGLTSTPIQIGNITFEMLLDFTGHQLVVSTSRGDWSEVDLDGQSAQEFCDEVIHALEDISIRVDIDLEQFSDEDGTYDPDYIEDCWQAFSQVDLVLKEFLGQLRGRKGPVAVWPHHFDMAGLWFSGRLVPGQDPDDEESADEQMNFGFSTGDEGIPDAYFYITAYPWPDGLEDTPLPEPAKWHSQGWNGAVMMYADLIATDNPRETLLKFFQTVQSAGAERMG
ncbi:MAG: DUF5996 family protein [Candidatus Promineifilaceae bacterium]